jgi:hypothetical protein
VTSPDEDLQIAELIFHGAELVDLALDDETVAEIRACASTRGRLDEIRLPRLAGCPCFTMSCEGHVAAYWPDQASNLLQESLVAQFLDLDEICHSKSMEPRLYRVSWTAMAADGDEYLLVCPVGTAGKGTDSGIIVLCVNERLHERLESD